MSFFDILNEINEKKGNEIDMKDYSPFMINRGLSYFRDTVLLANEMNRAGHIDTDMQYEFYKHSVSRKTRRSKWAKAESDENIDAIIETYKVSRRKAMEILPLINNDMMHIIKERLFKGGR